MIPTKTNNEKLELVFNDKMCFRWRGAIASLAVRPHQAKRDLYSKLTFELNYNKYLAELVRLFCPFSYFFRIQFHTKEDNEEFQEQLRALQEKVEKKQEAILQKQDSVIV